VLAHRPLLRPSTNAKDCPITAVPLRRGCGHPGGSRDTKSSRSRIAAAHIAAWYAPSAHGGSIRPESFPPEASASRQYGLRPVDAPVRIPHEPRRKPSDLRRISASWCDPQHRFPTRRDNRQDREMNSARRCRCTRLTVRWQRRRAAR